VKMSIKFSDVFRTCIYTYKAEAAHLNFYTFLQGYAQAGTPTPPAIQPGGWVRSTLRASCLVAYPATPKQVRHYHETLPPWEYDQLHQGTANTIQRTRVIGSRHYLAGDKYTLHEARTGRYMVAQLVAVTLLPGSRHIETLALRLWVMQRYETPTPQGNP
jgi:hypothetical protein